MSTNIINDIDVNINII